jgi:hypothetical protein
VEGNAQVQEQGEEGGMTRREMLAMLAAGGVVTATGIWMPGTKLVSIPKMVRVLNPKVCPCGTQHYAIVFGQSYGR